MIQRYSTAKMDAIWSEANKWELAWKVEIAVARALGYREDISIKPDFGSRVVKSILEDYEAKYKHDVLAFLAYIEDLYPELSKYLHRGMTSSDLVDTVTSRQLFESEKVIAESLMKVQNTLEDMAWEHRETVCIGRSHGMHGEVITFGQKCAIWRGFISRALKRVDSLDVNRVMISGPMGNFTNISPSVEIDVATQLLMRTETVSNQVIPRDRHADYIASLAFVGAALEVIATEIRHLSRTEVGEVSEGFNRGQRGSSSMPHKKNPIGSENICGISRMLRSYLIPALENIPLWHERDISHSSVERVILPDASHLAHYAIERMNDILKGLVVNKDRMLEGIKLNRKNCFSGNLLNYLVDSKNMSRSKAYDLVQSLSFEANDLEVDLDIVCISKKVLNSEEVYSIFKPTIPSEGMMERWLKGN
jgi:adenylosuccinate lyase